MIDLNRETSVTNHFENVLLKIEPGIRTRLSVISSCIETRFRYCLGTFSERR